MREKAWVYVRLTAYFGAHVLSNLIRLFIILVPGMNTPAVVILFLYAMACSLGALAGAVIHRTAIIVGSHSRSSARGDKVTAENPSRAARVLRAVIKKTIDLWANPKVFTVYYGGVCFGSVVLSIVAVAVFPRYPDVYTALFMFMVYYGVVLITPATLTAFVIVFRLQELCTQFESDRKVLGVGNERVHENLRRLLILATKMRQVLTNQGLLAWYQIISYFWLLRFFEIRAITILLIDLAHPVILLASVSHSLYHLVSQLRLSKGSSAVKALLPDLDVDAATIQVPTDDEPETLS